MGKIKVAAENAWGVIERNLPSILTYIGIAGQFAAVYFSIAGRDKQKELEAELPEDTDMKQKAMVYLYAYWRAALCEALSVTCHISSDREHLKKEAGLVASYALYQTAYRDFTNKAEEKLGEKKVQQVYDEIAKDKLQNNQQVVIIGGPGENMIKAVEPVMGHKVYLNIETVKQAEEWFKGQMEVGDTVDLVDLYDMMGMPNMEFLNEEIWHQMGWNYKMFEPGRYSLFVYSSDIDSMTQEPFLVLQFRVQPAADYKLIY